MLIQKIKSNRKPRKKQIKVNEMSIPEEILIRLNTWIIPKEKNIYSFEWIKGVEDAKKTIKYNLIYPNLNPGLFKNSEPVRAILLYGYPGNGKTLCAQAIANEMGWTFINIHTAMVMSKMYGESEMIMHYIFIFAKKHEPWVLFFDEIDALLSKRSSKLEETTNRMVSVFLENVGGVEDVRKSNILIIGATNLIKNIDNAVLRRFNLRIEIKPPSLDAIRDLIGNKMYEVKADISDNDFEEILSLLEGYCAADIINICNLVIKEPYKDLSSQDIVGLNFNDLRSINLDDFINVIKNVGKSYEISSMNEEDI